MKFSTPIEFCINEEEIKRRAVEQVVCNLINRIFLAIDDEMFVADAKKEATDTCFTEMFKKTVMEKVDEYKREIICMASDKVAEKLFDNIRRSTKYRKMILEKVESM